MNTAQNKLSDLGWVLDQELVQPLPGVLRAILLSRDGLVVTASKCVERDMADTMAAAASGIQALSQSGAAFADCQESSWELTLIQYGTGHLLFMAAGANTYLVVAAGQDADLEALSFAAEKTVDRLGRELGVGARNTADPRS